MIECVNCEGNGVIVVGTFGEDMVLVDVCLTCDGEGSIIPVPPLASQSVCFTGAQGGCCG